MAFATKKKESAYIKKWQSANREKMRANQKRYSEANRSKILKYKSDRFKNDVQARIARNLRTRIRQILWRKKKVGSPIQDLGCGKAELKEYLNKKLVDGMNWENYGKWHIDHIIPLSSFDLTNREHFLKANNYENLQPLWSIDNIMKGNKIISGGVQS